MNETIQLPIQVNGSLGIGTQIGKYLPTGMLLIEKEQITCEVTALLSKKTLIIPINIIQFAKRTKGLDAFLTFGTVDTIEIVATNQPHIRFMSSNMETLVSVLSSLGIKTFSKASEVPVDQRMFLIRNTVKKLFLIIFIVLSLGVPIIWLLINIINSVFK